MSRSQLLSEQQDWIELQQCRGWQRLTEHLEGLQEGDREALEIMTPDNVALPRAQGRLEGRKQALHYPAQRVEDLIKQLKGELDGR